MTGPTDEALVHALRSVALETDELAGLRRLYEAPAGFEYPSHGLRQQALRRCTSVGRRIGKCMGRPPRAGRDLIGYWDPDTGTWRMRPGFRSLMRRLGWVEGSPARTLVEELDELDDFGELEALSAVVAQQEEAIRCSECLGESDREELLKARFGHGRFRAAVQANEPGCRVTGICDPKLLLAAHVKPWVACSNRERLDGANGLLLAPSFHLLFTKGYISFDPGGRLNISAILPEPIVRGWAVTQRAPPRSFARRQVEYLEYHAARVFKR